MPSKGPGIFDFLSETEVLMVIGYKIYVDWIESAAIDLLLLDWLQYYKDMHKFWGIISEEFIEIWYRLPV